MIKENNNIDIDDQFDDYELYVMHLKRYQLWEEALEMGIENIIAQEEKNDEKDDLTDPF